MRNSSAQYRFMSESLESADRAFREIERDLEDTIAKLKVTFKLESRRGLLREIRILLAEADTVLDSP